jgi:hypothetical protein
MAAKPFKRRVKARLQNVVRSALDESQRAGLRDITVEMQRIALHETARFVIAHMQTAKICENKLSVLDYAIDCSRPEGLVAEFGVWRGTTMRHIASRRPGAHGFDSFQGLPEAWREYHEVGKFSLEDIPDIRGAVLHPGWFEDTVPGWSAEHPGAFAFVHMDADLYTSTTTVFRACADKFVPGTVILFDEYFNYPGWQDHEHKAFREFLDHAGLSCEYVAYVRNDEQVVAIIR